MNNRTDIYQSVTDTIIAAIEGGISSSLELPWHCVNRIPENAKTGNRYQGINIPLLWACQVKCGYSASLWASYRQWTELGAQVKRGEKGAPVVFWKAFEVQPEGDNQQGETRYFARHSTVFNIDQVEGFKCESDFTACVISSIGAADALIDATGAEIRHGGDCAYYSVAEDYIALPCPAQFKDSKASTATQNYYSTLFHELIHWSGARHRLDRFTQSRFGDPAYAFEELVAELGAAFLCGACGVESAAREDHSQYIGNWLKALKGDRKFIFSAASQAQRSADFLLSFQQQQEAA